MYYPYYILWKKIDKQAGGGLLYWTKVQDGAISYISMKRYARINGETDVLKKKLWFAAQQEQRLIYTLNEGKSVYY
ncbi:hypothetical protein PGRAT_18755 [Paenibacillus graminis]|jgi:hypothetical protein|uniref:Uncharacterized protein n=1 Tax=Paenibacillus graminis TaxID=189425 RepID=A0A089M892_9BACL|nr:hypothetical protein PGRAT_18755 [Paenibacillus graminis]